LLFYLQELCPNAKESKETADSRIALLVRLGALLLLLASLAAD